MATRTKRRPWVRKSSPEWREVIRRRALGVSREQIAKLMDIGPKQVAMILAAPEAKEHLQKLMDDADREFIKAIALAPFASLATTGRTRKKRTQSG